MAPRLVALDVDGTLLTSDLRLTERTRHAVVAAVATGIAVCLATARAPVEIEPILAALPGVDLVVGLQGAWVGRWADPPRPIAERPVPPGSALAVTAAATRRGLSVGWFGPASWTTLDADATLRRHARVTGVEPSVVADLAAAGGAPHKVMVMAPSPALEPALDELAAAAPADCLALRSHRDYLEVTAAGVDKASGLLLLLDGLGVDPAAVLAIGDADNDVGLLRATGRSVAMGNATAAARAAAGEVTASNDEDGVALVLEQLVGQRAPGRRPEGR